MIIRMMLFDGDVQGMWTNAERGRRWLRRDSYDALADETAGDERR